MLRGSSCEPCLKVGGNSVSAACGCEGFHPQNAPMVGAPGSSTEPSRDGPHLVLYDGACGLCHGLVQFILARDPGGLFHFASLQSPVAVRYLSPFGVLPSQLTTVFVVADYPKPGRSFRVRARAVLFIGRALGWPWRLVSLLGVFPTAWLDRAYDWVARHRHRFFGRRETCLVPPTEYRERFLDQDPSLSRRSEIQG